MSQDGFAEVAKMSGWPGSLVSPVIMKKLEDFYYVAVAREREACAKLGEQLASQIPEGDPDRDAIHGYVDAIRARRAA